MRQRKKSKNAWRRWGTYNMIKNQSNLHLNGRKKNILIVAAHPDDEIIGCGATASLYSQKGHHVYSLILGEGVTSRYDKRQEAPGKLLSKLRKEALSANKSAGVKEVFFGGFPDNRFDKVQLLDLVKVVEQVKQKIKPDIVFVHHPHDRNIDHRLAHEAALIAFRPLPNEKARLVLAFEVAGSMKETDGKPGPFAPNYFVDISKTINQKTKCLRAYRSEMRKYPHPRSLEGLKILAQARGLQVGKKFAEAFQLVRLVD